MYLNELREYIVNKECLIRHGRCVVIDGADDRFDLLEEEESPRKSLISLLFNNSKEKLPEPPVSHDQETRKKEGDEERDDPYKEKDKNNSEGYSDRQQNEDYEKKNDGELAGNRYKQAAGDEASKQKYSKAGARYDMPDIENEKIRDVMEKIRIFEEKVDKVRKMKFIKKY